MKRLLSLLFLLSFSFPLLSFAQTFRSSGNQTPMLELFSSEGCSSCPPADRWFSKLKQDPGLWKKYVPAVFHVTYWDYLGWKDIYAREKYDDRQSRYVISWGQRTRYTPGVVYNAQAWKGWYQLDYVPETKADIVGVLEVTAKEEDLYRLVFVPQDAHLEDWSGHLALLGFEITSPVRAGENSGRTLKHDFVVLHWVSKSMAVGENGVEVTAYLAKPEGTAAKSYGIAAWVTQGSSPKPVQATGGFL